MTSTKSAPKDSLVMASILKDMGIIDYEPRVLNQMLEFTYRYITNILEDARVFSTHAKKKNLDIDDVKLAIQMQMDKGFATPPPRDILIDISRQRNNIPLPLIKPHCGPRLPPDRYCLSATNYRLKPSKRTSKVPAPKLNIQTPPAVSAKVTPAISLSSKTGAQLALVTKGLTAPTVSIVTRPAPSVPLTTATGTPTPNPIFKITAGQPGVTTLSSATMGSLSTVINAGTTTASSSPSPSPSLATKVPILRTVVSAGKPLSEPASEITPGKRKREDDEDYDAE